MREAAAQYECIRKGRVTPAEAESFEDKIYNTPLLSTLSISCKTVRSERIARMRHREQMRYKIINMVAAYKTFHRYRVHEFSPYLIQYLFLDLRQVIGIYSNPLQKLIASFNQNEVIKEFSAHPLYITRMLPAFFDSLKSIRSDLLLTVDHVKTVHKLCTKDSDFAEMRVHGLIPGEFKQGKNCFGLCKEVSTDNGIAELKEWARSGECNGLVVNGSMEAMEVVSSGNREDTLQSVRNLLCKFNESVIIENPEKKHTAICQFCQKLVRLHPFPDGNTRSIIMVLFNVLLIKFGFQPALIPDPNMVDGISLMEFKQLAKNGSYVFKCAYELYNEKDLDYMETFVNVVALIYSNKPKVGLESSRSFEKMVSGIYQRIKKITVKKDQVGGLPFEALLDCELDELNRSGLAVIMQEELQTFKSQQVEKAKFELAASKSKPIRCMQRSEKIAESRAEAEVWDGSEALTECRLNRRECFYLSIPLTVKKSEESNAPTTVKFGL